MTREFQSKAEPALFWALRAAADADADDPDFGNMRRVYVDEDEPANGAVDPPVTLVCTDRRRIHVATMAYNPLKAGVYDVERLTKTRVVLTLARDVRRPFWRLLRPSLLSDDLTLRLSVYAPFHGAAEFAARYAARVRVPPVAGEPAPDLPMLAVVDPRHVADLAPHPALRPVDQPDVWTVHAGNGRTIIWARCSPAGDTAARYQAGIMPRDPAPGIERQPEP